MDYKGALGVFALGFSVMTPEIGRINQIKIVS